MGLYVNAYKHYVMWGVWNVGGMGWDGMGKYISIYSSTPYSYLRYEERSNSFFTHTAHYSDNNARGI